MAKDFMLSLIAIDGFVVELFTTGKVRTTFFGSASFIYKIQIQMKISYKSFEF